MALATTHRRFPREHASLPLRQPSAVVIEDKFTIPCVSLRVVVLSELSLSDGLCNSGAFAERPSPPLDSFRSRTLYRKGLCNSSTVSCSESLSSSSASLLASIPEIYRHQIFVEAFHVFV
jgi:hypothetical protein